MAYFKQSKKPEIHDFIATLPVFSYKLQLQLHKSLFSIANWFLQLQKL